MSVYKRKKAAARLLYLEGRYSQKDIGAIIEVSDKTLYSWIKDGEWNKLRADTETLTQTTEDRVRRLLNRQLKLIEETVEGTKNMVSKGDIDAISKFASIIKSKDTTWLQIVKTVRELTDFIRESDLELAKAIIPIANKFLNVKKELS